MLRRVERGFTLIEVVVVFAILAVLTAVVLPSFSGWMAAQRLKQGARPVAAAAPLDDPGAVLSNGTTFVDPAGNDVNWVAFRPDGVPVGFDDTCTFGQTGSGGGGGSATGGRRDAAPARP